MRISDWSSDVCSSDLFRKTDGQVEKSWSGQASAASDAGNAGIGSCSPVGAGGATGCNRQMMRTAKQQRKQHRAEEEVLAEDIQNPCRWNSASLRPGGDQPVGSEQPGAAAGPVIVCKRPVYQRGS